MAKKNGFFVVLFLGISLLPCVPIFTSLFELRNSVVLDQKVDWVQGAKLQVQFPGLSSNAYEFRLESMESKWEPIIKAQWKLLGQGQVVAESATEGVEWNMTRPFYDFKKVPQIQPDALEMEFLNSNPEKYEVRLKISKNREMILDKHTRLFVVLLALSLGLSLVIWKPLLTAPNQ